MRRAFAAAFGAALLFISAHRLPAPIQEVPESPTPPPEQSAKPKSDSNNTERAEKKSQPKIKQSPFAAFQGLWTGNGTVTFTATATGLFGTTKSGSTRGPITIRVSNKGVVGYATEAPVQGTISLDGRVLSWRIQKKEDDLSVITNSSLRLTGANVASYSDTIAVTVSNMANGTGSTSGTLYKH